MNWFLGVASVFFFLLPDSSVAVGNASGNNGQNDFVSRCGDRLGEEAVRQKSPILRIATSFTGQEGESFTLGLVGRQAYVFQDGFEPVASSAVPVPVVLPVDVAGLEEASNATFAVAPSFLPTVGPGGLVAIVERGHNRLFFHWPAVPPVARRRGADPHQPILPDLSQAIHYPLVLPDEAVQAVSLYPIKDPCCVRVFVLTDKSVYTSDLNPNLKSLDDVRDSLAFERNRFYDGGGRFIQAVGPETLVIATEQGAVSLVHQGKAVPLAELKLQYLVDFAAVAIGGPEAKHIELWALGKSADRDRVLIYHSPTGEGPRKFEEFSAQLPPGEAPLAIAASATLVPSHTRTIRQTQLSWQRSAGQAGRWLTRILVSSRRSGDHGHQRYTVRGVVPVGEGQLSWLEPHWMLVESGNSYRELMAELGEIAVQTRTVAEVERLTELINVLRGGLGSPNDFSPPVTDALHQLLRLLRYRRATLVPDDAVSAALFPAIPGTAGKTLAMFLLRESAAENLLSLGVSDRLQYEDKEEVGTVSDVLKQTTAMAVQKLRAFEESKRNLPRLIHDLIGAPAPASPGRSGRPANPTDDVGYFNEVFFAHAREAGNTSALLFHRLMAGRLRNDAFRALEEFLGWVDQRGLGSSADAFWRTLVQYLDDTSALPWGAWDPENLRVYLLRQRANWTGPTRSPGGHSGN